MAALDRVFRHTDQPMTWTRAIIVGTIFIAVAIILLGQLPSVIIYAADQYVAEIIEFSKRIPGVSDEGLNTTQIKIVRDIVANSVQMGALVVMLVGMYIWQERKRKRTGGRGLQDVVKGYMPGK
ncbi:MAG TPA: hypothetical protein VE712_00295 [Actinomycetota bacterium]|jgi:hypothetical protein|nr:hypothetical protein [Actinomycetota bacterium]